MAVLERWDAQQAGDDCLTAIVDAMSLANDALNLIGVLDEPRGSAALAWEAVHSKLLDALKHSIAAAAFAERNCVQAMLDEGRQQCSGCWRYLPPERLTRHEVGYKSKSESSRNAYFTCSACDTGRK